MSFTASTLLRRARREAGLSQRALADAAGVHQSAIARIEVGRVQPTLPTLETLLHACGHELHLDVGVAADPHDLSLLATTLPLTPEQRVDRNVAANQIGRGLQEAVRRTRSDGA